MKALIITLCLSIFGIAVIAQGEEGAGTISASSSLSSSNISDTASILLNFGSDTRTGEMLGIEHPSGVPRVGTFFLIYDNDSEPSLDRILEIDFVDNRDRKPKFEESSSLPEARDVLQNAEGKSYILRTETYESEEAGIRVTRTRTSYIRCEVSPSGSSLRISRASGGCPYCYGEVRCCQYSGTPFTDDNNIRCNIPEMISCDETHCNNPNDPTECYLHRNFELEPNLGAPPTNTPNRNNHQGAAPHGG